MITNVNLPSFNTNYGVLPPLLWAAAHGDLKVIKTLLTTEEVDIDEKDHRGWTALVFAAALGHLNVVKFLLSNGARLIVVDEEATGAVTTALNAIWPKRRISH